MRNAILISIVAVVLVAGAATVMAGPPLNGTYKSTDGDFDEGREASSWAAGGGFLSTGGVLHAESWDGAALGGDWKIVCPQVVSVVLIADLVFGGNGSRIYQIDYNGGYVELGGAGPWGNGDPSYTGTIDTYTEIRTVLYSAGVQVGSVSDHSVGASLQGYTQSCVSWAIGNGVWLGNAPVPAGYPSLLDPACNPTATTGHYGDIRDLTLSITGCAVGTREATWGSVKSLYRD
ncbi:MAG: hypothetical protein L0Z51_05570 [Candidatus Latescibacteria bacterium]|nr:hypothetical protein [Candidatus Latescibacterota bacterium]